ncbi:MAG TPA: hypothetical protein VEJ63_20655, partial [Planctomycetota bacterium]|nr:hypothetical protein [Planctomycetota bacterium]
VAVVAPALFAQEITLTPTNASNFRFKDALGQAYSSAYISSYSYGNAGVKVTIDTTGNAYLSGTIVGTGLKPNFAYQLKLSGLPSKMATTPEQLAASDDATNERIGKLGRWYRQQPNPANSTDADYEANKSDPNYIFQGYLIIGFFMTDANGAVNTTFTGNNSFHVLWREDQRPRSPNDGPAAPFTLPATGGNPAYDVSLSNRPFTLYGEWEPTRALPGQMQMPSGDYRATLVLTEESFHDASPLSGNWTTVLNAPLNFTMPTNGTPGSSGPPALPLTISKVRAGINLVNRGRDVAIISGSLALDQNVPLEGQEISITALGVTRTLDLARGRGRSTDTTALCKRDRKNRGNVLFQMTIRKASLIVFNAPPGGRAEVMTSAQVRLGGNIYEGTATAQFRGNERRVTLKF